MLDVNQLSEKNCLRPGCSSACQWIVGNEVFSINVRAEAERLQLRSSMGNGKTWSRPFRLSICLVGSAAVISFALDLEMELIADGEWPSCTSRVAIFCADIVINHPVQGSCAEVMMIALTRLDRALRDEPAQLIASDFSRENRLCQEV
jgi:hypothetical protein